MDVAIPEMKQWYFVGKKHAQVTKADRWIEYRIEYKIYWKTYLEGVHNLRFWAEIRKKKSEIFIWKFSDFGGKIFYKLKRCIFVMGLVDKLKLLF